MGIVVYSLLWVMHRVYIINRSIGLSGVVFSRFGGWSSRAKRANPAHLEDQGT